MMDKERAKELIDATLTDYPGYLEIEPDTLEERHYTLDGKEVTPHAGSDKEADK